MLLSELEQRIADYHEQFGDEADPVISVAVQPNYPMTAPFKGVATGIDLEEVAETDSSFWLVIGDNDGYDVPLHRELWNIAY